MDTPPKYPKLTDGAAISVNKRVRYDLDCPKCRKALDVTDIAFGKIIQCPGCKNITWRPEFQPRWYFRLHNFVLAVVGSFILGLIINFASSFLWEQYFQAGPVSNGQPNTPNTNQP